MDLAPFTSLLLTALLAAAADAGNTSSEPSNENSGGGGEGISSHFVAILVVANVIVLVVIFFLLIIYYKKYKKLKEATKAKTRLGDGCKIITDRATEKMRSTPEGGEKGKLVFMETTMARRATFELEDLFRASAEGLGRGNFGNCYKAMLDMGQAVVVKRLMDLKPLSREEFVRQVRAIADQKHPNLLPLVAYYYSKEERLFLYPFAPHGNLFNRLHGNLVLYHLFSLYFSMLQCYETLFFFFNIFL